MADPPDVNTLATQVREEIAAMTAALLEKINSLQTAQQGQNVSGVERFFSSGLFFTLLGLILLGLSYAGLAFGVHSSFSFVLVVLGVAILLFGTGTQGIGKLDSTSTTANYNVALAGGAGVLALGIGYGMAVYGKDMQRAFDVETRYVVAELKPKSDGNASFAGWWPEFSVDGIPIPSVKRGDKIIVAYVPYFDTDLHVTKKVSYILRPVDPRQINGDSPPVISDEFPIQLETIKQNNSGSDFPIYEVSPAVDMRSKAKANEVLQAASNRSLLPAPGAVAPKPTVPAQLDPQ